ncbi:hypothetical protein D9619_001365 [Psilocybe cf. subviscida]|uniref:Mediator complex subunit Med12 domain-containing protein n=1 Tax=Psilocybe cf. subviscida TaxID=2480587 RepID=A0A8H5BHY5_9AGAR|nr:hypothetical protein D9619_001365 [Psilocybe cf. subviscida]
MALMHPKDQKRFAAHVIIVYLLTEMKNFLQLRHQFLISPSHSKLPQARTVLITPIPQDLASDAALRQLASFVPGGIDRIWLYRDTTALNNLFERRQDACELLEKAESTLLKAAVLEWRRRSKEWKKNRKAEEQRRRRRGVRTVKVGDVEASYGADRHETPEEKEARKNEKLELPEGSLGKEFLDDLVPPEQRPKHRVKLFGFWGQKVDTINWCRDEISHLNKEIVKAREHIVKGKFLGSAFIRCNLQMGAHILAQCLSYHEPEWMANKTMEAHPKDIVWRNLDDGALEIKSRYVLSWLATAGLIFVWAFPVAFVGTLSNLSDLCTKVSWLEWVCKGCPAPNSLGRVVRPPPTDFEGSRLMLITMITAIEDIIKNPTSAVQELSAQLPGASVFFLTYMTSNMTKISGLVTQGLAGAGGALVQLAPLIIHYFRKWFLGRTPRQAYDVTFKMPSADFGTALPRLSLLATITFAYSVLSPLINLLAFISFAFFYVAWKFREYFITEFYGITLNIPKVLTQVFDQPDEKETGGAYFPMAINNLFVGLYIEQICLACLFFLKVKDAGVTALVQAIFMIILLVLTAAAQKYLSSSFKPLEKFLPMSLATKKLAQKYSMGKKKETGRDGNDDIELGEIDLFSRTAIRSVRRRIKSKKDRFGGKIGQLKSRVIAGDKDKVHDSDSSDDEDEKREKVVTFEQMEAQASTPVSSPEGIPIDGEKYRRSSESTSRSIKSKIPVFDEIPVLDEAAPAVQDTDTEAEEEEQEDHTFDHPSAYVDQSWIWIPKDPLGLSEYLVNDLKAVGIDASDVGANMDDKGPLPACCVTGRIVRSVTQSDSPPSLPQSTPISANTWFESFRLVRTKLPMRDKRDEMQPNPLPAYEAHPPQWLPKIHAEADLGYVGYHPPKPGQEEDALSENNVKNGYHLAQPVSVETFSAQSMINESLGDPQNLTRLEQLMNEVFIRRADRIPPIPQSTFKIPTRVTLNDSKRQAWFADLANSNVPLHKLGKSVPHGAKGHDLLDMLHTKNVAIPRAVWLLRVLGANETAGLRNKPTYVPTQYSVDWANIMTSYMKKQLQEIALPSAPRLALNIKQTFKGVLGDAESREKWMSRFAYCLKLLRTFYAEDLVDHRTFLTWLVQQMITCNLAQAGFVSRLTDEYLNEILPSRALARPLVEACLVKLSEIQTTSAYEFLKDTAEVLKVLVQASTSQHYEQNCRDIGQVMSDNLESIKSRNEAMLFHGPIAQASARLGSAVSDVKLLNSISAETDLNTVPYFCPSGDDVNFKEKLDMLLTWSVTPLQFGDHRPFAAVTLIRIWRDKACDRASRRDFAAPNDFLQDQLFDWLDTSEVAEEKANIRDVALLYGKLVKYEESPSRHRLFLSWIPLVNSSSPLSNQRKVTLHGARARETPEDLTEREIRKEIRTVLPELFEGSPPAMWTSPKSLLNHCQILMKATRFEQVRTFRQWLIPVIKKYCSRHQPEANNDLLKGYLVAVELMTFAKCFNSILDLTLFMVGNCVDTDLLNCIISVLDRYVVIWNCMDAMSVIVKALDSTHQAWKLRGVQSRSLLALLSRFDHGRHLDQTSRDRIASDFTAFTMALQPISDLPASVPDTLLEIMALSNDLDPNAPSTLATTLWIKYRSSFDWGWKTWDNAMTAIQQIARAGLDAETRNVHAMKYCNFLWKVDQHLPNGLDNDVLQWLLGQGKIRVGALDEETWEVLRTVLVFLVIHGSIKTTTVLQGLIYPAWREGPTASPGQQPASQTHLSAANKLFSCLLLQDDDTKEQTSFMNLFETQCIRTMRQAVYEEPHFPLLVESIPTLIAMENNDNIPTPLRSEASILRQHICQESGFRQGAYRNLDIIRNTFENSPYLIDENPASDNLIKSALAGLQMILSDSTGGMSMTDLFETRHLTKETEDTNICDWKEVTSLLSPWKIAATTIQMQIQVKKLGRALSHQSTSASAVADLNKLTSALFRHTRTAEEAYYVGEMARGSDSAVASKFINNGLHYMTDLFADLTLESDNEGLKRVGELLRVLIHVSQPFRDASATLPTVEPGVLEKFIAALEAKFKLIETELHPETIKPSTIHNLYLLTRLLQFTISFKNTWNTTAKQTCIELSATIFRIALYSASQDHLDLNVYPQVIDTLLAVYDELPSDHKSIAFDPYKYYSNASADDISPEMPPEYYNQLLSLIQRRPQYSVVTNLLFAHHDEAGNTILGTPVINKPWEWIENIGEPTPDPKDEAARQRRERDDVASRYSIRNAGSISLDHFAARVTSDGVRPNLRSDDERGLMEGRIRGFEDGLSESVFARDWRETRRDALQHAEMTHDNAHSPRRDHYEMGEVHMVVDAVGKMRASPTSSIVSRGSSTQGTGSSLRQAHHQFQSPLQGTSSVKHEVIDVDSMQIPEKRKAGGVSDDDIEIVEGPVPVSKKQKVAAGKATGMLKPNAKKK